MTTELPAIGMNHTHIASINQLWCNAKPLTQKAETWLMEKCGGFPAEHIDKAIDQLYAQAYNNETGRAVAFDPRRLLGLLRRASEQELAKNIDRLDARSRFAEIQRRCWIEDRSRHGLTEGAPGYHAYESMTVDQILALYEQRQCDEMMRVYGRVLPHFNEHTRTQHPGTQSVHPRGKWPRLREAFVKRANELTPEFRTKMVEQARADWSEKHPFLSGSKDDWSDWDADKPQDWCWDLWVIAGPIVRKNTAPVGDEDKPEPEPKSVEDYMPSERDMRHDERREHQRALDREREREEREAGQLFPQTTSEPPPVDTDGVPF